MSKRFRPSSWELGYAYALLDFMTVPGTLSASLPPLLAVAAARIIRAQKMARALHLQRAAAPGLALPKAIGF